jgi:chromatin remodeling complex protein RSC6
MPAKAAEKKPSTGGKAPAGKAPATEKKEAGKKTAAAPSGEKKKRGKTRKETYSSYIYKGMAFIARFARQITPRLDRSSLTRHFLQFSSKFTQILVSPTVPCPF